MVASRVENQTIAALRQAQLTGEVAQRKHAEASGAKASRELLQELRWQAENDPEILSPVDAEVLQITHHIQEELPQQHSMGVCCFSDTAVNQLLWSHYGDQHRGICIGYSAARNPAPAIKQVQCVNYRTITTSIIYNAIVNYDQVASTTLTYAVLLRIAPDWAYESEWRLVGNPGLSNSALRTTDVVFGLRCEIGVKFALYQALSPGENLMFWNVKERHGTYMLKLEPFYESEFEGRYPEHSESAEEMFGNLAGGILPTPKK